MSDMLRWCLAWKSSDSVVTDGFVCGVIGITGSVVGRVSIAGTVSGTATIVGTVGGRAKLSECE